MLRIFCAFIFLLQLLGACQCGMKNERNITIENFSDHYSIKSYFSPKTDQLVVEINLGEGLHAYAEGEKIGKPVSISIENKNNWQALGLPDIPKGKTKQLGSLGESKIIDKNFSVKQKLKRGQGDGAGTLYLQVCASDKCDRPRAHPITWSI